MLERGEGEGEEEGGWRERSAPTCSPSAAVRSVNCRSTYSDSSGRSARCSAVRPDAVARAGAARSPWLVRPAASARPWPPPWP